jgi:hypothetical protein
MEFTGTDPPFDNGVVFMALNRKSQLPGGSMHHANPQQSAIRGSKFEGWEPTGDSRLKQYRR